MSSQASTTQGKTQGDRRRPRKDAQHGDQRRDPPGGRARSDNAPGAGQTGAGSPQLLERTQVGGPPPAGRASASGNPSASRPPGTPPAGPQTGTQPGLTPAPGVTPTGTRPGVTPPPGTPPAEAAAWRRQAPRVATPLFGGALAAKESPMRMRHLIALCGWALALTLLGMGVGLWAMLRLMSTGVPAWYEPVIVLTGMAGVGCTIAAFVTANRRYTPWALMGASTAVLLLAIGLTLTAG